MPRAEVLEALPYFYVVISDSLSWDAVALTASSADEFFAALKSKTAN